jgi:hypothetical protein
MIDVGRVRVIGQLVEMDCLALLVGHENSDVCSKIMEEQGQSAYKFSIYNSILGSAGSIKSFQKASTREE